MKRSLYKDRFREIRRSPQRFLSIFLIVAIGTAFFAGVKASAPDMKHTADLYYDEYNMMDIRVLSTMGLTADDMTAVAALDGVERVQPSYFADVVTMVNAFEFVFRIHALPSETLAAGSEDFINRPRLVSGRYPEASGECIIESSNAIDLGLREGDRLTVSSGRTTDLKDVLKTTEFTIVGRAVSPYYLTYDKDATDIGSGKVNFFMMILSSDFAYPVYVEALVTVKGARSLNSYTPEYRKLVERTRNQLENLVAERSEIRLADLKAEANRQLAASREELRASEDKFKVEIGDAQVKLDDARDKLVGSQATLDSERRNADLRIADAQRQIDEGEVELREGEKDYASALARYNSANAEFADTLRQLDQATKALNSIDASAGSQIASIENLLATDPTLSDVQRQNYYSQIRDLKEQQAQSKKALRQLNDLNTGAKNALKDAKKQLDESKVKLDESKAKLEKAKADLAEAKTEAAIRFAEGQSEIDDGNGEYTAAKADFDNRKSDGEAQIAAGRERVIRAEAEIERLSKPSLYVLDRSKLYSYADYAATADRMDAIARLFPVFFFAVAVLVCLTTMTRMVDEQRGTIGTFKALGYTNSEIILKYITYAILASLTGGILGVIVGVRVFPQVIFDSWSMMYTLPPMQSIPQYALMALTVAAGIVITTAAAYAACRSELQTTPALLMRPKAPKAGKPIILEQIGFIWRRFGFSQKVTARNIFRYKKRFYMTIVGIAGCAALLVAGFGLNDSISQIVDRQYKQIFTYNLSARFQATAKQADIDAVARNLDARDNVSSLLRVAEMNAKIKSNGDEIAATLICPEESAALPGYVSLRSRASQTSIGLPPAGVVLTEKLARELGVGVGDAVAIDNGIEPFKKIEVAAITEHYIFHYAYISRDAYAQVFRLPPVTNTFMIRMDHASAADESQLGSELIGQGKIASVVYFSDAAAKFQDMVVSLRAIVLAIIICAGLLAFVVLYNLTNINLSERIREIATIKVLGFYNMEVARYVYRENVLLSVLGAAGGLLVGIYLHRTIMASIEQTGVMFGDYIASRSFLYAFAMTFIFTMMVNVLMYRRLNRIHMVESLKSIE